MIHVWCVCVGNKYTDKAVYSLQRMVNKNLKVPFTFNVLDVSDKPGWWAKIDLLKKDGPGIYFDLDVVIVDDITELAKKASSAYFSMPRNWARSGHGGFQSSFSGWSQARQDLYSSFNKANIGLAGGSPNCPHYGLYKQGGVELFGDQEWITHNFKDKITPIPDGEIVSYKYHCQNGLPAGAKVVCFHGKPDYWEVKHEWIDQALS